jgi:flavin-dependent dehydrogenase
MEGIYDVAVVGGGPAGEMLTRELARLCPHLRLLLVDGQTKRNPKVCGGLLAPDAQKMFAKLGLTLPTSLLSDPQIFDVETIDLRLGMVRYYQRHYLNMDRYAFDRWLISLIPSSAEIFAGRCMEIRREDLPDGETEFTLDILSEGKTVQAKARWLVGADGANSRVRKTFFGDRVKKYIAIQQTFPNGDIPLPPYSCIFDPDTGDSCSWTIRKEDGFLYGGAFDVKHGRERFEAQKARLEAFLGVRLGEPLKTEACRVSRPHMGKGIFHGASGAYLIGEAAGFISPSSFEGISYALSSGEALAMAFNQKNGQTAVLRVYRRRTLGLSLKIKAKCLKRPFMYVPFWRKIILKTGLGATGQIE